nr:MAG TPA: hypothetical protein [Caudoviricetes sp.]
MAWLSHYYILFPRTYSPHFPHFLNTRYCFVLHIKALIQEGFSVLKTGLLNRVLRSYIRTC